MTIELRRRTDPLSSRVPPSANDNAEQQARARPRRRVNIFRPAKSAMTSGRARTKPWLLEFEPQSAPFIEPLMGWTGSTDPLAHLQLAFGTREAAIAYAERHDLEYEVCEPAQPGRLEAPAGPRNDATNPPVTATPLRGTASVTVDLAA